MKLKIVRLTEYEGTTLGVLLVNGWPLLKTLELPWIDNQKQISCIPEGAYPVKSVNSPRFGETYEICNVTNRSHILLHSGNTTSDSSGCVIVGTNYGKLDGKAAVLQSRQAFQLLCSTLGDTEDLQVNIVRAP